jgi:valyl-tRNA synthetase
LPQRAEAKSIALDHYPEARVAWKNEQGLREFELVQEVIQGLRTVRAEMKLDPKKKVAAEFFSADAEVRGIVEANREGIVRLGWLSELRVTAEKLREGSGGMRSTARFDLQIPYPAETTDAGTEIARLKKEMEGLKKAITSKENQLGNETFRSRAPQNIIEQMQQVLAGQRIELQKIGERLKQLGE